MAPETKILFIEAYATLAVVRIEMAMFTFKYMSRRLAQSPQIAEPPELTGPQLDRARLIGAVIELAGSNTPWKSACLARAFAAHRMLKKRAIPGVFYLGAAKEKEEKNLKAHAWTRCADSIITGAAGHEAFTVISSFSWSET